VSVRVSLVVVVILCFLCGVVVWGLTVYSFKVAVGEMRIIGVGVGVYWDSNCDNLVDSLSWGTIVIDPLRHEVSKNVTVYVKNESNNPVVISLDISDWSPLGVEKYMRLSWDYDGRILDVDDSISIMLELSAGTQIWFESSRIQEYAFNIVIMANPA